MLTINKISKELESLKQKSSDNVMSHYQKQIQLEILLNLIHTDKPYTELHNFNENEINCRIPRKAFSEFLAVISKALNLSSYNQDACFERIKSAKKVLLKSIKKIKDPRVLFSGQESITEVFYLNLDPIFLVFSFNVHRIGNREFSFKIFYNAGSFIGPIETKSIDTLVYDTSDPNYQTYKVKGFQVSDQKENGKLRILENLDHLFIYNEALITVNNLEVNIEYSNLSNPEVLDELIQFLKGGTKKKSENKKSKNHFFYRQELNIISTSNLIPCLKSYLET